MNEPKDSASDSIKSCPDCQGKASLCFHTQDYNRRISEKNFNYYDCENCGFIFLSPVPVNLKEYYPADYYGGMPASAAILERDMRPYEGYKVELIKKYAKTGRLLEIGPSMGGFAVIAKSEGFDVEAVEMDSTCCQFLNEVAQIPTIHAQDEISGLAAAKPANIVAMWHVVEHVTDPFSLIQAAHGKLLPGGIMVIAAPNPGSLQFKALKGNWTHVDAPRHVCLIPLDLLFSKIRSLGMEILLQTTNDAGAVGWNKFGWEYSFPHLARGPAAKRWAKRMGTWLTPLMKPFEESGMRGSAYTIVARKPLPRNFQ